MCLPLPKPKVFVMPTLKPLILLPRLAINQMTIKQPRNQRRTSQATLGQRLLSTIIGITVINTTMAATITTPTPDLNSTISGLIDEQQTDEIGAWVLREINQKAPLTTDPWLQESLKQLLAKINAQARNKAPLALVIIKDQQINAFAVPGGLIAINTGLIDVVASPDELASVLAHEVAHVSQRHFQHRMQAQSNDLLIHLGGLLASILVAKQDAQAASAIAFGSQALVTNKNLAYSRTQEREADRIGMRIMYEAGFDPHAMPRFFATLNQRNAMVGFIPKFVLTHPLTTERLSEAKLRADNYPNIPLAIRQQKQNSFELIQWRLRGVSNLTTEATFKQAAINNHAAKLGLAKWYINQTKLAQAAALLRQLATTHQHELLYQITLAEYHQAKQNYQKAVDILQQAHQLMPERRDLRLYLAENLTLLGQGQQALELLKPLVFGGVAGIISQPQDVQVWQAMQQAASQLVTTNEAQQTLKEIQVLTYRAHAQFWQNELEAALLSAYRANVLAKEHPSQQAKIQALIQQIKVTQALKL